MRNGRRDCFQREVVRCFWSIKDVTSRTLQVCLLSGVEGVSHEPVLGDKTEQ